jgi:type 2 lantibiotic biosynthesis protein LanM
MIRENNTTLSTSLSHPDLRDIVAAASTISERLNGNLLVDDSSNSEVLRQQRLDAWCRIASTEDKGRFQEMLSWDGHNITEVRHVLGHMHLREHAPLPTWTALLQEALHLIESLPHKHGIVGKSSWRFLDPDQPYPFEETLAPFVVVAQQRYAQQAGSAYHLLSDEAQDTLQHHLLQVLTSLSLNTLHAAFLHHQSSLEEPPLDDAATYQLYTEWMYQGGLATLLHEYSFLARLLASTTDLWIASHVEFLQRLASDWQDIQQTFGGDTEHEQVIAIDPALSDPHHGRRFVMALTLASGKKLVYKPRNIGMEVCYNRLLNWCNEHGATPPLQVLTTIDRANYGWVEFVEHEPCQDAQAAQRYYRRAGMLLCLAYVLGGTDLSYEHIIAHGEHPVLIDPGTLLHHYPCPDHQDEPTQKQCSDWEQQQFSVLHTGLLTGWQPSINTTQWKPDRDISGFAMNEPAQPHPRRSALALKYGMLRVRERLNVSVHNDSLLSLAERHAALSAGFTHLYRLLLNNRSTLLALDSPLQLLGQQTVRVPYRANQAYQAHLAQCLKPEYMQDGIARGIELERLWHEYIPVEYKLWREGNNARWRQVYQAEQQALLEGDIPFFTARADSTVLFANRAIAACLHQPSFALLLQRVARMSEGDLHTQSVLLQHALHRDVPPVLPHATNSKSETAPTDALFVHALTIAQTIIHQAIPLGNNAITWLQPQFGVRSYRQQLQPMRYSLFSGVSGITLFLAAIAKISDEIRYRAFVMAALKPLCQSLHADGEMLAREMGIGGAIGLGSIVYTLTHISRFLDDSALLEAAREAAHLIRAEHITNDQALDVIAGSAGAILGLLTLYDTSHDQSILDRAVACGNHLLQTRTMSKAGCLAWPTLSRMHTTGFSHGTAGIAYALVRLYSVTGDTRLLNAAREGLIYENHAFISKAGNWAEILTDAEHTKPAYIATWCHGAPGIGLARIGGLPSLDNAHIQQDIEVALQTTQHIGMATLDHVCCGNSGRAEILLAAAQKLARPELADVAKHTMENMVSRAEQKQSFLLDTSLPRPLPPPISFFQGSAGIGYTLLRMVYPNGLPSVLLWE